MEWDLMELKEKALELYKKGYSISRIAKELKVSDRTIRRWIKETFNTTSLV